MWANTYHILLFFQSFIYSTNVTISIICELTHITYWYMHFASLYLYHIWLVYIVICIIHSLFMHFRWFLGLSYKASPSVFNFRETENLLFLYFAVSGTLWTSILIGDFYNINILPWEASGEVVAHEGSHEAQTRIGGVAYLADRATRACLALSCHLASVFLCTSLFRQKRMP
jgi:hypothetical protein